MSSVLQGIRVLDFGRYVAGPFCAALLADFGAEVIRIERVGGSEDRFVMPVTEEGEGALFLQANRNKRSITLDIDRPEGREVVQRLVRSADVVVVNMPPQTLLNLGLDYATLRGIRADIIVTVVSAFGGSGPYSERIGFDGVGQAMSGSVYLSGTPGQPTKAMVPTVDFATAMSSAMGTLAALYERRTSGQGQRVEASLLHTALNLASGALIEESALGVGREPIGNRNPIAGPSDIFRVTDGRIIVQVIGPALFKRWTRLVGRNDLLDDTRFRDDIARGENGAFLSTLMAGWCRDRSRDEALQALEGAKIPAGPVYSPRQVLADEHIRASGFLTETDYPGLKRPVSLVSPPVSLSRTPARITARAPTIGEHTNEILAEVGYDSQAIALLKQREVI